MHIRLTMGALIAGILLAAPSTRAAVSPEPTNLALGGSASQSSTIYGDEAYIANDGADGGDWSNGTATLTGADFHSWWEIDLGASRHIGSLEIINRTDCCQDLLFPFAVLVSDFPIIDSDITDADGSTYPGITRIVVGDTVRDKYVVPVHRTGRYVRIALLREYTNLSLGEVKIFEDFNVALGRGTDMLSDANGTGSAPAVDGNLDGYYPDHSVVVAKPGTDVFTKTKIGAWWQVDLGVVRTINSVDVWSTNTTCCSTANPPATFTVYTSTTPIFYSTEGFAAPRTLGVTKFQANAQGAPATVNLGSVDARFVAIQLDNVTDYLSLAEVQVWALGRGALGSYPTLSSKATSLSDPFSAINFSTKSEGGDVQNKDARTATQTDPYFELDLGADRYIEGVKLWGQSDLSSSASYSLFTSELTPFPVGATVDQLRANQLNSGIVEWKNVGTSADSLTGIMRRARWIRVMIQGANQYLGLRELEVNVPEGYVEQINGLPFGGTPPSLSISGFHGRPNEAIDVYAFKPNYTAGSGFYNNWTYVGSAMSSATALFSFSAASTGPIYPWKLASSSLPAGTVVQGGVLSVYAEAKMLPGPSPIPIPLRATNSNASFRNVQEESPFWPQSFMFGVDKNPDQNATPPPYLLSPMGKTVNPSYYGIRNSATNYFEIPSTLAKFNSQYGLGGVNVKYFNRGDLGIGRNMSCARPSWTVSGRSVKGTVCAVANYAPAAPAGSTAPVVFGDKFGSLFLVKNNKPPFATVVMVKRDGQPQTMFGVYVPTAPATTDPAKTTLVQSNVILDTTAQNTAVPNNCVACHGGSAGGDPLSLTSTSGFLPFDPDALDFDSAPLDYGSQAEKFRTLNSYIALSSPTPAVADLINGAYHGKVATANTPWDRAYIPAGWSSSIAQKNTYTEVIKPFCRGCHISQVQGLNNGIDMLKAADMEGVRALVLSDVCLAHRMPHAQIALKGAWSNAARATLLGYFARGDLNTTTLNSELCKP